MLERQAGASLNFDGSTVAIRQTYSEEELLAEANVSPGAARVSQFNDHMETRTAESAKAKRKKLQVRAREVARADEERRMEEEIAHRMALGIETASLLEGEEGGGSMSDVRLMSFDLSHKKGKGDLLRGANLILPMQRRMAVIGRNGCGKSTLLEAIARRIIPGYALCFMLLYGYDLCFCCSAA